ncbi:hypothetical protein BVG19_g3928 [[Candida] boidinii]|nr:hypothetical protein BVG19_g3928 [[Candida] boidinii]OWB51543.1 hypothetical protein B5S27_g3107 [[Candida] boidinii]
MSSVLLTILIASLVLIYLSLPYLKNNLTDVDILALLNQSSTSHTRKLGETTIYRSIDVPHGFPLTTGLRIRSGYNLRDGNLKDIWYNCIIDLKESNNNNNNNIKSVNFLNDKNESISFLKLNKLCHDLENSINGSTKFKKINLMAPLNQINSLTVLCTGLFMNSNYTLNYISNEFNLKDVPEDSDIIFTISANIPTLLRYLENFTQIIVLDEISDNFLQNSDKIIRFADFIKSKNDDKGENEDLKYDYNPDDIRVEINPLIISSNKSTTKFYQRNFVSAISSQLMSLPKDHNWNPSDKLLISINDNDSNNKDTSIEPDISNFIVKFLSGLLSSVNEITISLDSELSIDKLIKINPSILSMNSFNFKKMINNQIKSDLPILSKISKNLITNEIFNNLGKLKEFESLNLRLVYLSINNNLHYNFQNSINSSELITILSILNTRIIVEKLNRFCVGPIFKTNLFDYRLHKSDLNLLSSSDLFYRKLGVASNCIESKLKDSEINGVGLLAENKAGRLFIRGFNIGKSDLNINTFKKVESGEKGDGAEDAADDEGWMPTEIFGKFGNDGCFYEYAISERVNQ